jgi:hypothetical protein
LEEELAALQAQMGKEETIMRQIREMEDKEL